MVPIVEFTGDKWSIYQKGEKPEKGFTNSEVSSVAKEIERLTKNNANPISFHTGQSIAKDARNEYYSNKAKEKRDGVKNTGLKSKIHVRA